MVYCECCRYSDETGEKINFNKTYYCMRHAPLPKIVPKSSNLGDIANSYVVWPIVHAGDFCGEGRPERETK